MRIVCAFIIASCSISCSKNNPLTVSSDQSDNQVIIDLTDRKQVVRNFGASDAWACQFVGMWPDEKRNQVADWLFSMDVASDGKPKGIGLSLWRFNIGAGSAVQKNITDEWRSTEGFLNDDLTYDWKKQAGQRWFMKAAKDRGVSQFVGFTNSPPVQYTKNAKAFSSNGEEANISSDRYDDFAKFLIDVTNQFAAEGIPFTYLSPFNEPQWDWTGNGQEGSPYKNSEIYGITKILDSLIAKQNIDVKLQVAEAGKLNYLFEKADKPTRGDQINEFFNETSPFYLGQFASVDRVISGHSYFTSSPDATLKDVRQKLTQRLSGSSVPLEFWQTEYCVLGGQEEIKPEGKDPGMDPALYIARLVHHDLAIANASAWQWWLAVSVYDYKDGLVYTDKNKTNGAIEDTKTLWALGNFSRFVRPGAVRVGVKSDNRDVHNTKGTMISSYVDGQSVITVVVNTSYADATLKFETIGGSVKSWQPYITSAKEEEDLKPLTMRRGDERITIPARSVVTLVGDLE